MTEDHDDGFNRRRLMSNVDTMTTDNGGGYFVLSAAQFMLI
jgi:hypothetical protein